MTGANYDFMQQITAAHGVLTAAIEKAASSIEAVDPESSPRDVLRALDACVRTALGKIALARTTKGNEKA